MGGVDRFVRQLRRYDHQQLRRIRHRFYGDHPQALQHLVMALAAPVMVQCFRNLVTQLQLFASTIHRIRFQFRKVGSSNVKRRRWESNPLHAALQAAAVPSGSSVLRLRMGIGDSGSSFLKSAIDNPQSPISSASSPGIEPGLRPSQSRVRIRHTPRTNQVLDLGFGDG